MLRRSVCALVVLMMGLGIAMAETYNGKLKSVSGNTITVVVGDKERKFEVGPNVKIVTGKAGKEKDLRKGLGNKLFNNIPEVGLDVILTTEDKDEKLTKIHVVGRKMMGKKKKDND